MTRFFVLGLVVAVFSKTGALQIPKTAFSCDGRPTGYYADVTTGCQVYHMCDGLGRKFSYMCPNATLFQQRMMICDHWFMVNCSRSEENYDANLLIGQRGKAFIDDATFSRTPRPDFLNPSVADYNIGFRKGKSQTQETKNLVGVVDDTEASDTNTDDPSYFPPSHWSTEYPTQSTTPNPRSSQQLPSKSQQPPRSQQFSNSNQQFTNNQLPPRNQQFTGGQQVSGSQQSFGSQQSTNSPQKYYRTNYNTVRKSDSGADAINKAKAIDFNSFNRNSNTFDSGIQKQTGKPFNVPAQKEQNVKVNFRSNFKATTPVYPTSVESTSIAPDNAGVLPPHGAENIEENAIVNFRSNFKATTPNYPTSVDPTSPNPGEAGLLPPDSKVSENADQQNTDGNSIVNFRSNFKATTPNYPTSVEPTSPNPGEAGLLPPDSGSANYEQDNVNEENHIPENQGSPIDINFAPPKFDDSYRNRGSIESTVPPLSAYFQPPKFDNNYAKTQNVADSNINLNNLRSPPDYTLTMKPEQWKDLRQKLFIPDYEFPLDPATRPSYDGGFNSFQVNKRDRKRDIHRQ